MITRIPLKIAIGDHFPVSALTADISQHGALILSPVPVPFPATICVQNEHTGECASARVVRSASANHSGLYAVGVEFIHAAGSPFWRGEYVDTLSAGR